MQLGYVIVVRWAGAYGLHIYRNLDEVEDAIRVFEHYVHTVDLDKYEVTIEPWFNENIKLG